MANIWPYEQTTQEGQAWYISSISHRSKLTSANSYMNKDQVPERASLRLWPVLRRNTEEGKDKSVFLSHDTENLTDHRGSPMVNAGHKDCVEECGGSH